MNDLKFALRQLRKNPGFTAVAVLTLALSIGANTSLFTAIDAVMFRPLHAREASRLVFVANGRDETFSFPFYERLRQAAGSLSGCAAAQFRAPLRELSAADSEGQVEPVFAQGVTGNFFAVLGVPALLGRTFVEEDDRNGAAQPVVVISHALWLRRFAADPAIIGRAVRLDNVPVTIVGVMPPDFVGFEADVKPDVWWPIQLVTQLEPRGRKPLGEGVSWLVLFGRLRDGITQEQAQAEVAVFFRRQLEEQVAKNPNRPLAERKRILSQTLDLLPGAAGYVGARSEFKQPLAVLMAAVGVVLLIASANIAGLLLARGAARQREFAVRVALGAGRGRIVRQLVSESILLALMGGAAGFIFAGWGTAFLAHFLAQSSTPLPLAPDGRALLFTVVASLLTAVVFGLAPAWRLSRLDLITAIKDQGTAVAGTARTRLQPLLVVGQVALSVLLLAGAGLFARTLRNLRTLDFGFQSENLIAFSVDSGRWRPDAAQSELLQRRLLAELETLPVPLMRGREFTQSEETVPTADGQSTHATVAILGEAMARRFFGDSDPVGRHFTVDGQEKVRLEIVGVAKDTRYSPNLRNRMPIEFYVPFFGSGIRMPATFYLRTDRDAAAFGDSIRRIIGQVEPRLKIRELRPMDEIIDRLLLRERIIAQLVGFFSGFALLLACLGLYGVLSFRVTQRRREIGVRMALGATMRSVIALVIKQGLSLALCGGVVGIGAALAATHFIAALLYGVTPTDPLT